MQPAQRLLNQCISCTKVLYTLYRNGNRAAPFDKKLETFHEVMRFAILGLLGSSLCLLELVL